MPSKDPMTALELEAEPPPEPPPPPPPPAKQRWQRVCVFLTAALLGMCMGMPYCLQTLLVDFLEAELPVSLRGF